ncbi:MAG: hypothetical protein ACO4BU_11475, partial [Phycisphaerales bacterium]
MHVMGVGGVPALPRAPLWPPYREAAMRAAAPKAASSLARRLLGLPVLLFLVHGAPASELSVCGTAEHARSSQLPAGSLWLPLLSIGAGSERAAADAAWHHVTAFRGAESYLRAWRLPAAAAAPAAQVVDPPVDYACDFANGSHILRLLADLHSSPVIRGLADRIALRLPDDPPAGAGTLAGHFPSNLMHLPFDCTHPR